jgi:hypothetical protein
MPTRHQVGVEVGRGEIPHMGARAATQPQWRRLGVGLLVTTTLLVAVLMVIGLGGWLAARTISSAICSSYNHISNDFCDEWNYETPPAGALPVPSRWEVRWETLDCGSGGCGNRLYVLSANPSTEGGVAAYLREIQALGWRIDVDSEARKDDLHLDVHSASGRVAAILIPKSLVREEFVFVALGIFGEGTVCD